MIVALAPVGAQTPPPKPTWTSIDATYATITLNWRISSNAGVTKYQYRQRKAGGRFGGWTDMTGSGAGSTLYTVAGVDPDTTYTYRIRAVSGTVLGATSDTYAVTTDAIPAPTLRADQFVTATGASVTLKWTFPSANIAEVAKFQLRYRTAADTDWGDWTDVIGSASSYTATGLTSGTEYLFRARAVVGAHNGPHADVLVRTGQPTSPTAPTSPTTPAPRQLLAPATARDLSVDTTTSPGSAIIKWKKPADIGSDRNLRCAYVSEGGDQASKHAAASLKYRYTVSDAGDGRDIRGPARLRVRRRELVADGCRPADRPVARIGQRLLIAMRTLVQARRRRSPMAESAVAAGSGARPVGRHRDESRFGDHHVEEAGRHRRRARRALRLRLRGRGSGQQARRRLDQVSLRRL